jgi:hypothetical protein
MTQGSAGRIRISIKDGDHYERSVLVTGTAAKGSSLVSRLRAMGLASRGFGQIVVASGHIVGSATGSFAEFNEPCTHQTLQDATRHAVRSLSALFREYGIEAEVGDEPPEPGLVNAAMVEDGIGSWARRS